MIGRLPPALLLSAVVAIGCGGCGRESSTAPSTVGVATGSATASAARVEPRADARARAPDVEDLWVRAKDGEADDLSRLANREGPSGLVEEGTRDPAKRMAAIGALAYADGLAGLPWLAEAADGNDDASALAAVDAIAAMAARTRRAVDPEDGAELRTGCDRLSSVAKNPSKKRPVRVGAVRALRMWSDRGCAKPLDLPTDVDSH